MIKSLLPREYGFFDLFEQAASLIVDGAKALDAMLRDLENADVHARKVKDIEHACDKVTHTTLELLHKTFITPLDRGEIHRLASRLDDIMDLLDAVSQRLYLFEVRQATPEALDLLRVLSLSTEEVRALVAGLRDLRKPKAILDRCIEINRLENEGDAILRAALARLFREEADARVIIKWKELYEDLESATDRCEDVANLIEGIVLENA